MDEVNKRIAFSLAVGVASRIVNQIMKQNPNMKINFHNKLGSGVTLVRFVVEWVEENISAIEDLLEKEGLS